jgi:hypothetical protein
MLVLLLRDVHAVVKGVTHVSKHVLPISPVYTKGEGLGEGATFIDTWVSNH